MAEFRTGSVPANGITLHVLELGTGPLVLCLYGFSDNAYTSAICCRPWRRLAFAACGGRRKRALFFLLCCRCCQALLSIFLPAFFRRCATAPQVR